MNELIELSILESGENININPHEFYPEDLFIDLKAQFESDMEVETKTTIRYVKPISNRMIVSDYKRLKQILYHLLNMAIYHPNVDSFILMGCENIPDQEHIRFYIKNETAVVDDVQGQIIKDSCQEGNGYDTYKFGLGLEFAKKMIKLIHGSFDLEIDDQRKVCAYVTIPIMLTTSEFDQISSV
jgi:K+-sensing histidine kinase KdpD